MKSETVVLRECLNQLEQQGYMFWRSNNMPVFGRAMPKHTPKGLPDIFIIWRGIFIGVECKRNGSETEREKNGRKVRAGMLSPHQAEFATRMAMNGGEYGVVRSVEDMLEFLEGVKKRRDPLAAAVVGTADLSRA